MNSSLTVVSTPVFLVASLLACPSCHLFELNNEVKITSNNRSTLGMLTNSAFFCMGHCWTATSLGYSG